MKSKILTVLIALVVSTTANAQFGSLGGLVGGSSKDSGGDVGSQVEEFNAEANLINKSVAFAMIQIVAALGDKTTMADIKSRNDSLSKSTNTKEIGAITGSIIKDKAAQVEELLKDNDAKSKMEKLSPEMQKKVGQSIFAVGVAALRIPVAMNKGKDIVSGVSSNPMNITKVIPVKDGLSIFADVLPKLPTLVTTGLKLMKDVNVEAGNPTAESKLSPEPASFPN